MKYEEIKVGESYKIGGHTLKVLEKNDDHKAVMTIDEDGHVTAWDKNELELFQPIKKELPETGLLVHEAGLLIYRTGPTEGRGFDTIGRYVKRHNWDFLSSPNDWRRGKVEDEMKFLEMLDENSIKKKTS